VRANPADAGGHLGDQDRRALVPRGRVRGAEIDAVGLGGKPRGGVRQRVPGDRLDATICWNTNK
jgi:hypothetical protein